MRAFASVRLGTVRVITPPLTSRMVVAPISMVASAKLLKLFTFVVPAPLAVK
jgi:hypothetical protein